MVPEAEMVTALVEEARRLAEEGVEARLAAADQDAAAIAEADRVQLLEIRGDVNRTRERRTRVEEAARGPAS